MTVPRDPAFPLLGTYAQEMKLAPQRDSCTPTEAPSAGAKIWAQLSVREWMSHAAVAHQPAHDTEAPAPCFKVLLTSSRTRLPSFPVYLLKTFSGKMISNIVSTSTPSFSKGA